MSAAGNGASRFELPIEPVPAAIVRREELAARVVVAPSAPFVPFEESEDEVERADEPFCEEFGGSQPPNASQNIEEGVVDRRRPVRAAMGLLVLIAFAAVTLTLLIGAAIVAIAVALRSAT